MQLVAYGAQDIYLTGNPQITFFKVVYRRHTNFSMETIEQTINGSSAKDGTGTVTISRNGDLVGRTFVSASTGLTDGEDGSALISSVEVEIGGQRIDKQTHEWNQIWNDLTITESKSDGFKCMTGATGGGKYIVGEVQVPLNFWFCRNPGLALPLIALQYHEVKLKFTWGALSGTPNPEVWCDYVYLDTDERRRFAQVSHEYLIEQLQKEDKTTTEAATNHKLNFNHPVKELVWTYDASATMSKIKLQLNGHDRFSEQTEEYFTLRQPFDYHTAVPRQNLPLAGRQANRGLLSTTDLGSGTTYTKGDGSADTYTAHTVDDASTKNIISLAVTTGAVLDGAKKGDTIAIIVGGTGTSGISSTVGEVFFAELSAAASATALQFAGGAVKSDGLGGKLTHTHITDPTANDSLVVYKVQQTTLTEARTSKMARKVGVYSFALKPEEHQPSGTCNFSRIDNAQLSETTAGTGGTLSVYAVNYNVLRIMSGMGGLAYSN